ncbi:MAG: hypothetical protein KGI78_00675 [Patescibacteria group bacterium]|nr:hypothetical protein [Patescibacteria group bacterium]MDE1944616.1 hypothetical protein [Patescibacteria group bacterium]MDE1944667.1 hypothetical protein [Patescibacteria group bacterium]MDE2057353.1 hypothetical protein [Patescibacteria group bacterium]
MRLATFKLNSYFAVLIITLVGSGAAFVIVHVGTTDVSKAALGNEAQFAKLQQSILSK